MFIVYFLHDNFKEIILNIFPQFKYYERLKVINSLNQKLRDKYDKHLIIAATYFRPNK